MHAWTNKHFGEESQSVPSDNNKFGPFFSSTHDKQRNKGFQQHPRVPQISMRFEDEKPLGIIETMIIFILHLMSFLHLGRLASLFNSFIRSFDVIFSLTVVIVVGTEEKKRKRKKNEETAKRSRK
jgi:hypothetical protein